MLVMFETKERRSKDRQEVAALFRRYGEESVDVLSDRVKNKSLSSRDRKHWKRILSKAKTYRRQYQEESTEQRA